MMKNATPAFLNRWRKARLSLRSRNQAHRGVHDFVAPSLARTQAVERWFLDSLLTNLARGSSSGRGRLP